METLYHGSKLIIKNPTYGKGNPENDYGLGFYCTRDPELAKEWACAEEDDGFADDVEDMDIHAEENAPEEPEEFPDEELYLPGNSPKAPADDDDDLFEDIEL